MRTPRGLHDEVVAAAEDLGITVAEYLQEISTPRMLEQLEDRVLDLLAPSTWFHPRTDHAARVRELACAHAKRQWEVWEALHRLYQQGR